MKPFMFPPRTGRTPQIKAMLEQIHKLEELVACCSHAEKEQHFIYVDHGSMI
jgi:hypothetical protein